jgi:hypothetical protein
MISILADSGAELPADVSETPATSFEKYLILDIMNGSWPLRDAHTESVQSSRWDEPIFLMIPGTSCLGTIVLSLRDKNIRPSKALAIILALMGVETLGIDHLERRALKRRWPCAPLSHRPGGTHDSSPAI